MEVMPKKSTVIKSLFGMVDIQLKMPVKWMFSSHVTSDIYYE